MAIISLNDIHVAFGPKVVFDNLSLRLYPHEKVALVGPNGCGKTTLLKLIVGEHNPDIGSVHTQKNLRVGYLPQEPQFDDTKTVIEELRAAADDILQMQNKIHSLAQMMGTLSASELKHTMRQYDTLLSRFEACGGYSYENKIKEVAAGLGLDERFYSVKTGELSGGQRSRLGLAKVLLREAQLLLLDEPTNHLDFDATMWLEDYLKKFKGAALIVSHDRFLLDRLVEKVVEIRGRSASVFGAITATIKGKEKSERSSSSASTASGWNLSSGPGTL